MKSDPATRVERSTSRDRAKTGMWSDPAAAARQERAESDLIYARWVLLAGAVTYLFLSENVQHAFLGWTAIAVGVLANGLLLFWRLRRSFSVTMCIVAQVVDTVVVLLYMAALIGGIGSHLLLYSAMIVVAGIRFGIWGIAASGVLGLLLALTTIAPLRVGGLGAAMSSGMVYQIEPMVVLGTILTNAALLAYFAYLVTCQHLDSQQDKDLLRKQISEITILHEVSNTAHDLKSEDALQNIVEIVTKVMGFQRAALFLADSAEMDPRSYFSCRISAKGFQLPQILMEPKLFDDLLQRQAPIVIDGSQGSQDIAHGPVLQIAVPLHGERGPIGVLVADSDDRRATFRSDQGMLASLAKSAVVAIENAGLHHRIKEMANHDGLTNLYNHRYFQEYLRETLKTADGHWPVALFMIEIDRFKRYNDTFGHRRGDTVLYCLSRALEECVKQWDGLVARYGGDEFVVVLTGVEEQEIGLTAYTLRERVYQLVADSLAEHNLPPIKLSIGVAIYPTDAQKAGDLIDAADQTMYAVKRDGGDCVRTHSKVSTILP